jgi:hypothetical protein
MSKENGSFIKLDEFPPKYPSKVKPTQEQMQTALKEAVKDFIELDLPRLEKPITKVENLLINK